MRELLSALARRDDEIIYRCYARRRWTQPLDARFDWRLIDAPDPLWHARAALAANRECDVFLSTNSYLTVWMLRIPSVAVIYDTVAFESAHLPNRRSMLIERLTLGVAVHRARGFVAISAATRADFVRRFPAADGRVAVVPLGVPRGLDSALAPSEQDALPQPGFVLAVGTLEPRKNLSRLAAAYGLLPAELRERHPLVVTGTMGWQTSETLGALRRLGPQCVITGHVSDAALGELYRRCALFCYPSLYEGFGLPVLEAMAAGAAVLTSDVSSLPEVGDAAVEYVDPLDVGAIVGALERLLRSPERRCELGRLGRLRASQFTWERTAELTLTALKRAVGRG